MGAGDEPGHPAAAPESDGGATYVDWHCHSRWSDGGGTVPELLPYAQARGVTLGISDHGLTDNARLRTPEQIASYLDDLELHGVLRGIELSLGDVGDGVRPADARRRAQIPLGLQEVEADTRASAERLAAVFARFDYAIASLHAVAVPQGIVNTTRYLNWRAGLYPSYKPSITRFDRHAYFEAVLAGLEATADRFPVHILGHFCLLPELADDKADWRSEADPEPDATARAWLDAVIQLCMRRGIAIELNSKSRVPHVWFVQRALGLGARFSLGSDAHQRHRAGDISYGRQLMRRLGIPPERILALADVRQRQAA